MGKLILFTFPIEEFETFQKEWFRQILHEYTPVPTEKEAYLTRKEVSELLQVSLPTVHEWSKKGILTPIRLNSRIRYKKSQVDSALESFTIPKKRRR